MLPSPWFNSVPEHFPTMEGEADGKRNAWESHPREQGGQLWNFGVSPNAGSLSHAWGWDAPMGTTSPQGAAPLGGGSGAVVILWKTTQFGFLGKGLLLEAELAIASSALSSISPGFTALRRQEG